MKFLAPITAAIALAYAAGCSSDDSTSPTTGCGSPPTFVSMSFAPDQGFYAAPFPSDARVRADGSIDMRGFPNPRNIDLVKRVIALLDGSRGGFGLTSGIFFQLSGAIRASDLPNVHASVEAGSPIVLLDLDAEAGAPRRYPLTAAFLADGGPFGAPNLLSVLPLQGVPLRTHARYAAIVTRDVHDACGAELGAAPAVALLAAGTRPEGMSDAAFASYRTALTAAHDAGIDPSRIAAFTVFTTGSPTDELDTVAKTMRTSALPSPKAPFVRNEVFDDYCVYQTTIAMPEYQRGDPPYQTTGGDWVFDASGQPVLQRTEDANFVVTIPRRPMPTGGYPVVVFSRTGAGGDRPLVDRGPQATPDGPPISPGTGPAMDFAQAGFAGSSIDGPHGGLRNITHGDEQFLIFNIANPAALRDNVRQSAAELALQAHVLENVAIDVSDCPGATPPASTAKLDVTMMALMGHSMGATIAPLADAAEGAFRALLLSGAGGSWIENVVYKQKPIDVKGAAEVLVGLSGTGYELTEYDPLLSVFQWAGESADPPVYADRIVMHPPDGKPRHVLMMQGIVDHYILPPIANATSLSLGLDLAADPLDAKSAELAMFTPLGEELDLVGRRVVKLPASGDVTSGASKATAIVVQHAQDGVEDGHEVVFQTDPPKHEYRCFLQGLASGLPRVPSAGDAGAPCD